MTNYNTIAQDILTTIGLAELDAADLANHLNLGYETVDGQDDTISVINSDNQVRHITLHRDENDIVDAYTYADYELEEAQAGAVMRCIEEGGDALDGVETLAAALAELDAFAQ